MNMNLVIAVTIVFAAHHLFSTEAALSIVSYDVVCPTADPNHFKDIEIFIEDEGKDNEFFVNFTIIKSLPASAMQNFKMIGTSMGEFVVPTGIDATVKLCDAISEPIFGDHLYRSLGLDPNVCPAHPGIYGGVHVNLVDLSTLPETFPANDYKIVTTVFEGNHTLFECYCLFRIQ